MIFRKQVTILSITIVVLSGLYVVGILTSPEARAKRNRNVPAFAELQTDQISTVEFPDGYNLKRTNDIWLLVRDGEQIPTRQERVENLLDAFASLEVRRTVTNNPARYAELGVGEDQAQRIQFWDSEEKLLGSVAVGDDDPAGEGQYARIEGSDDVVAISGELGFFLSRDAVYWADLRLFADRPAVEEIQRIGINSGEGSGQVVTIVRSSVPAGDEIGTWQIESEPAAPVNQDEVDRFVRAVFNAEAQDRRGSPDDLDTRPKVFSVSFWDQSGNTYHVDWFEEGEQYLVTSRLGNAPSSDGTVLLFDQEGYDRLTADRERFVSEG